MCGSKDQGTILDYCYTLNGVKLDSVESQRDLGIVINNKLSPSEHVQNLVSKSNRKIHMIKRCFSGLTPQKISVLYTSIVRPVLEYASITWSPWLKKDILALEQVQKRCLSLCKIEMVPLESLEKRRKIADMVETYKFLTGKYKTNPLDLFSRPFRNLRGHSWELFKPAVRKEVSRNFFTNRVIENWNNLPAEVVNATSTKSFAKKMRAVPLE